MPNIISRSNVSDWYDKLNAILTKHGLNPITVPDISNVAAADHVTPLTDKLQDMKSDTYYKLATYSDWGGGCCWRYNARANALRH